VVSSTIREWAVWVEGEEGCPHGLEVFAERREGRERKRQEKEKETSKDHHQPAHERQEFV